MPSSDFPGQPHRHSEPSSYHTTPTAPEHTQTLAAMRQTPTRPTERTRDRNNAETHEPTDPATSWPSPSETRPSIVNAAQLRRRSTWSDTIWHHSTLYQPCHSYMPLPHAEFRPDIMRTRLSRPNHLNHAPSSHTQRIGACLASQGHHIPCTYTVVSTLLSYKSVLRSTCK